MILRLARTLSSASLSLSFATAFSPTSCCPNFRRGLHLHKPAFHPGAFSSVDDSTHKALRIATLSSLTSHKIMPGPPYQYQSPNAPILDLTDLSAKLKEADVKRQEAYDKSRTFQKAMIQAQKDLDQNKDTVAESIQVLQSCLAEAIGDNPDDKTGRVLRTANLNQRVEDLCRFMALSHFFTSGTMLPPSVCFDSPVKATDEEYLAGACMGLCQDLSRYALGRATARDVRSVQQARDLVNEILDYLLQFDFRNGFLRRKYDGTKYALKSLETLLYELSVTGASLNTDGDGEEPDAKKPRLEETESLTPLQEELDALRLRMEHRDSLRETLIKKCRDGQKAAKQAIYALHRKDYKKAAKLIQDCENCIHKDLLPIVEEEPPLRSSSFAGVIEEYAEAKLFYVWLLGKESDSSTEEGAIGTLLMPDEFSVALDPDGYLGGLCDLTGEIGRFAVQRGTARDYDGVRQCLEANSAIFTAIQSLEKTPNAISKKMGQLRQSVSKIERMLYEMSLSEAAGMKVHSEVKGTPDEEE